MYTIRVVGNRPGILVVRDEELDTLEKIHGVTTLFSRRAQIRLGLVGTRASHGVAKNSLHSMALDPYCLDM